MDRLIIVPVIDECLPGFVKPKYIADYALFQHCNHGLSRASSRTFLAEVWPEILLHRTSYVGYTIEKEGDA